MKKKIVILLVCIIAGTGATSFLVKSINAASIKNPHLAGSWYPKEASQLKTALDQAAQYAEEKYTAHLKPSSIRAVIAPHAGIMYSGAVAASVYALAQHPIQKIIVLAPDHSGITRGVNITSYNKFSIPTGLVPVDRSVVNALSTHSLFKKNDIIFEKEHSFEMQLPFIHKFFNNVPVTPLIIGNINCDQAASIAEALKPHIDEKTLIVVTSDFIHYGTRFGFTPFATNQQNQIRLLDSKLIELIGEKQCDPFASYVIQTGATICGTHPIMVLLQLIQQGTLGKVESRLIAYDRSGKTDVDSSVSYVGMLFTTQKLNPKRVKSLLTQQEKRNLYQQAITTLRNLYNPKFEPAQYYAMQSLGVRQPRGAFTTLYTLDNRLRGCIGRITTPKPLYQTINTITRDTALKDSRFPAVHPKEIPNLKLKLSILTAPRSVSSYQDIVIGKHGIILKHDGRSAVFLPDVPTDFKWGLKETLTQLSKKAGLEENAWKHPDTSFEVFETIDIENED